MSCLTDRRSLGLELLRSPACLHCRSICRELLRGEEPTGTQYLVEVVTSDLPGAGSDANVHLQMFGDHASGHLHQLAGSPSDFERQVMPQRQHMET